MKKKLMSSLIRMTLVILFIFGMFYVTRTIEARDGGGMFADPGLEALVRREIDNSVGTIENIEYLNINPVLLDNEDYSIKDLSGLENLTGLKRLSISGCDMKDISPLSSLTALEELIIDNCEEGLDLAPLSALPNLKHLYITDINIIDLSPLSGLTDLRSLHLQRNEISDISPLSSLTNLVGLAIIENQVSDISPLSNLMLGSLDLYDNRIEDITPLETVTGLNVLGLSSNLISNISVLSGMSNLYFLELVDNDITDLAPIADSNDLTKLKSLNIKGNPLTDTSITDYISQLAEMGVDVDY